MKEELTITVPYHPGSRVWINERGSLLEVVVDHVKINAYRVKTDVVYGLAQARGGNLIFRNECDMYDTVEEATKSIKVIPFEEDER